MTAASQTIKAGTRIELHGTPAMGGFPGVAPEQATIGRWTKANGPMKNDIGHWDGTTHVYPGNPGWHVIVFADGGKLLAHETRFRVIDNRAA
jgi:hypothetical protein